MGTHGVSVLDVNKELGRRKGRGDINIIVSSESNNCEVKVGSESKDLELPLRQAWPHLRLLAFAQRRGVLWQSEDFLGYCQVPLELLKSKQVYEGDLNIHHPITHECAGAVRVRLSYSPDRKKTRLSMIAPTLTTECDSNGRDKLPEEDTNNISKSIDLVEFLSLVRSVTDRLGVFKHVLRSWFCWECVPCSLVAGGTLCLMVWRPQYAGVWMHTWFSTVMIIQGAKCQFAKYDDVSGGSIVPISKVVAQKLKSGTAAFIRPADKNDKNVSLSRWMLLRAAEFSGVLQTINPVLLAFDGFLDEVKCTLFWEDTYKATCVTMGSIGCGLLSAFFRMPKMRVTAWASAVLAVGVLGTAPCMAASNVFCGSISFYGDKLFHRGRFPKVKSLETVNRMLPWESATRDPGAWRRIIRKQRYEKIQEKIQSSSLTQTLSRKMSIGPKQEQ